MIYDQPVDSSSYYAPAQTNVVIRSQGRNITTDKAVKRNFTSDSAQRFDISKFSQKLSNVTARRSSEKCAKSIRVALQSAGAKIQSHPVAAADWGSTLTKLGYKKINPAFDNPQRGDIYIIDRTGSHAYGHIAGYSGSGWVSDFKQNGYAVYKNENVKYSYYRIND